MIETVRRKRGPLSKEHRLKLSEAAKNRTGEKNNAWKGGRFKTSRGYVMVRSKGHPNANTWGYILEHRLIMEQMLGRLLERCEKVHHINGNKIDNRPENLELWTRNHPTGVRVRDRHCPTCTCPEHAS